MNEAVPETGVPTCYRHPGRETHVRCTRCDRYICPDCMQEASVGFQCPECVREGNRGMRQAQAPFGGQAVTTAWATRTLIAVNVLIFFLEYGLGDPTRVAGDFGLWPPAVADGEYHRLITSAFLHYGPAHLALNMWALYAVGEALEGWLGRTRFLALYFLSALGGSVLCYLASAVTSNTAGASGAVFGLFGAIFVVARRMNMNIRPIAAVIVLNLVFTFVWGGISWQGHIGGLVTGALVAAAFVYAPQARRTAVQVGTSVLVVLIFLVLIVLRTTALTTI
ncbi:MAG: rhomboid family intramembrane serine protease [Streptosporangiaceae bacterium]